MKKVSGTLTQIGISTHTMTAGEELTWVLNGTSVIVKAGGTEIINVTESANLLETMFGCSTGSGTTGLAVEWDNVSFTHPA